MKLTINGEVKEFASPLTLAGLVQQLGMKADRVAVELNRDIVSRDRWADTALGEGDQLEIVQFVGGGGFSRQPSALSRTASFQFSLCSIRTFPVTPRRKSQLT